MLVISAVSQERKGIKFETETDTEVIPKLMFHLYELKNGSQKLTFEQLVEETIRELVSQTYQCILILIKDPLIHPLIKLSACSSNSY